MISNPDFSREKFEPVIRDRPHLRSQIRVPLSFHWSKTGILFTTQLCICILVVSVTYGERALMHYLHMLRCPCLKSPFISRTNEEINEQWYEHLHRFWMQNVVSLVLSVWGRAHSALTVLLLLQPFICWNGSGENGPYWVICQWVVGFLGMDTGRSIALIFPAVKCRKSKKTKAWERQRGETVNINKT